MRTYTLALTEGEFLFLKRAIAQEFKHLGDPALESFFTVPELLEIRKLQQKFSMSQPNQEEGTNDGKEKEV